MQLVSGFLIFVVASASATSSTDTIKIAIDPLASLLENYIQMLNASAQGAFNSIENAVEYQYGTTINVPGELSDLPQLIKTTQNTVNAIRTAVTGFFAMIQSDYYSPTTAAGPVLEVPIGQVKPYVSIFSPISYALLTISEEIGYLGQEVQNGVVALLSSESVSSDGDFNLPVSTVNYIINDALAIINNLNFIGNYLYSASHQSKQAEVSGESFKPSAVMKAINSGCEKFSLFILKICLEGQKVLNIKNLPITQTDASTDRINLKVILSAINGFLNDVLGLSPSLQAVFREAINGLNLLQNPIADAFISFV